LSQTASDIQQNQPVSGDTNSYIHVEYLLNHVRKNMWDLYEGHHRVR